MTAAEQAIIHGLFAAIREMFKRDFEADGRAYAALAIDMTSQTLTLLARLWETGGRGSSQPPGWSASSFRRCATS